MRFIRDFYIVKLSGNTQLFQWSHWNGSSRGKTRPAFAKHMHDYTMCFAPIGSISHWGLLHWAYWSLVEHCMGLNFLPSARKRETLSVPCLVLQRETDDVGIMALSLRTRRVNEQGPNGCGHQIRRELLTCLNPDDVTLARPDVTTKNSLKVRDLTSPSCLGLGPVDLGLPDPNSVTKSL